ncbi:4Fe-4S dicluster domain-containing protein [Desulfosporosinus sp. BICA1-9]|uniref:4Fe-4S dicluster domain-containing protein n=1 Tax=Desulfosporosinus sp. BICA1-9 TaxID=1531958 RepID=UPI00054B7DD7|nr:4Fe-4S dicluster domain-containing protein [Desulfosporosinus sp. BICA1-9]KJS47087.1 MAG: 4Fe-4S ferredoxin [Peptococcaceae bacterium BRH_c23]KJS90430.1 MAG: 4Fe-4S ferredoxin [Desulfosporosinus sp. BICA1-9]HBW36064.1 4Fe-4S ferredoxin [Desulfosporosinus sp.]
MNNIINDIREKARQLLAEGKVDVVIGYEKGSLPLKATPCFVHSVQEVDSLIWDETCENNLAAFVAKTPGKKAIVAKGCDSRALVVLLQENQLLRDDLYIIGVSCQGVIDQRKIEAEVGEILEASISDGKVSVKGMEGDKEYLFTEVKDATCQTCRYPNPVLVDLQVGELIEVSQEVTAFADVTAMEDKSESERQEYFKAEMSKCIRCYACRNACPLCYCQECFVDCNSPRWLTGGVDRAENLLFQTGRVLHLAGRCVDCGTCSRACPQGVDIRALNRKMTKDVYEMYNHESGINEDVKPALNVYSTNDPEEQFLVKE